MEFALGIILIASLFFMAWYCIKAVSYTHLDVYKRQVKRQTAEFPPVYLCRATKNRETGGRLAVWTATIGRGK